MAFRVGQKVQCINAGPWNAGDRDFRPGEAIVEGAVYTVLRTFVDFEGDEIVHLFEVKRDARAVKALGPDAGYAAMRFRPLVETKTDISVFTSLLTPKPVPERV